jgi:hypothetical protein
MMGVRGTLVLALLVVIGAGILLYEGAASPPDPRSPDARGEPLTTEDAKVVPPLVRFHPDDVDEIILRSDGHQVTARREGGTWPPTTPVGAVADFLENLSAIGELMRLDGSPDQLRECGLDPPQGEIEIHRASGAPLVLLLGERNPAATGAYVRVGRNGHVALAGALILWEFDKAYKALGGKGPDA